MIQEIQIRGCVKTLKTVRRMLTKFREEIVLTGLPSQLAINDYREIDYDLDDNDGKTTEITITYRKEI